MFEHLYYHLKPIIPRSFQLTVRRKVALYKRRRCQGTWPIDPSAASIPEGWAGWPGNKKFALVLSHDVDTAYGSRKAHELAALEQNMGFRSSFNFVPERYNHSSRIRLYLDVNGFEVAVHGLIHDGKLFWSREIFQERAIKINRYLKEWGAVGFHSPSMHRNLEWIHDLNIEYDQSTFDTDPFEPQPDGVGTIFPFWIPGDSSQRGYLELPYTLPQDHALFVIMRERDIRIWKEKLDWIAEKGGMALLNTHPDYMNFNGRRLNREEYPAKFYADFLEYVHKKYQGQYWHVLPREIARFWSGGTQDAVTPFSTSNQRFYSKGIGFNQRKPSINTCMIAYTFYENDQRVRRYAEALVKEGHRVDMIVLKGEGQGKRAVLNGVNLHRIQSRAFNETGPLSFLLPIMSFFFKGSILLTLRHLKYSYKVVHIHNLPDFLVFMSLLPKLLGAKIILDIHDILPEFYSQKFNITLDGFISKVLMFFENLSVRFANHVIVANDIWRKKIITRDSVPASSCTTILNYPILAYYKYKERSGIRDGLDIVYPGTLSNIHGIDIAINAMALVKKKVGNARLYLYARQSNLSYRKSIEDLVDSLGLRKNVRILSPVSPCKLGEIFSSMDIGLVPKRGGGFASEAFSTKILEFMASGLPVVASRTTVDEYYFDDSMIMFFRPEDPQDLANTILELYRSPRKCRSLSIAGRQFVDQNNWDDKREIYLEIVDSLANSK